MINLIFLWVGWGKLNISCYLEIFFKQPRFIINILNIYNCLTIFGDLAHWIGTYPGTVVFVCGISMCSPASPKHSVHYNYPSVCETRICGYVQLHASSVLAQDRDLILFVHVGMF